MAFAFEKLFGFNISGERKEIGIAHWHETKREIIIKIYHTFIKKF